MNKFKAILLDTLLEIRSSKIIYFYGGVTALLMLVFALFPSINIDGNQFSEGGLFGSDAMKHAMAFFFNGFFGFVIFLMVFGSAWLLPSYLKKGRVELVLSKPINRYKLLSLKFLSVFILKAAILMAMSILIWIVLAIRLETFSGYFFYGLLFGCLQFLAIYTIVFAIGVIGRSGALAVMGYFAIAIFASLLSNREVVYNFLGSSVWKTIIDVIYYILPKLGEMDASYKTLMTGNGFAETFSTFTTLAFSAILFLATLLVFQKRDY
jgi:ABC-type transport system involved in multi-copper enzyme maturation permease subunit